MLEASWNTADLKSETLLPQDRKVVESAPATTRQDLVAAFLAGKFIFSIQVVLAPSPVYLRISSLANDITPLHISATIEIVLSDHCSLYKATQIVFGVAFTFGKPSNSSCLREPLLEDNLATHAKVKSTSASKDISKPYPHSSCDSISDEFDRYQCRCRCIAVNTLLTCLVISHVTL